MARAVNLSEERLLEEFNIYFKEKYGRLPTDVEIVQSFVTFKDALRIGFDICRDATSDPYPD